MTGAIIIAVRERTPGDIAIAESLKPDVARSIQSTRLRAHFDTWAEGILAEARGNAAQDVTLSDDDDYLE